MNGASNRFQAIQNFDQARRQARLASLAAKLTGKDNGLLPFEAVRDALRLTNPVFEGVRQIDVGQIVGSIGRYSDFNRRFLPLNDNLRERWIGVETLAMTSGWPPIEVYQVGSLYFVRDGNHRVAVAQQLEIETIEAKVWAFPTEIEIDISADLNQSLLQAGNQHFRLTTNIDAIDRDHNISFTLPGQHDELLRQINEMGDKIAIIDGESPDFNATVHHWYELIYLPTIQIIRESTLLDDFPGRTEADLFVWLSKHRDALGDRYGEFSNLCELAQRLAEQYKESSLKKMSRQVRNLLSAESLPPLQEAQIDEN